MHKIIYNNLKNAVSGSPYMIADKNLIATFYNDLFFNRYAM